MTASAVVFRSAPDVRRKRLIRYGLAVGLLLVGFLLHLQLDSALTLSDQWRIATGAAPDSFEEFQFYYAAMPRALLAVMVGAVMALVGSLLQQVTQNPLLSPMTLGASSGAWLALVCVSIWLPDLLADYRAWFAMGGALVSVTLVLLIAGRSGLGGLPVILAGMATHILMGAVATAVILLNPYSADGLFIWGAGDLTQTDWEWVRWLLPKLSVALVILLIAPRPLTLLRLGDAAASARGLSTGPVLAVLLLLSLWLVSSAITAVGVISFIGLIAPNIARNLGARTSLDELVFSLVLGALFLLFTDGLAVIISQWTPDMVPSGTTAALIGAPALIWFARSKLSSRDQTALQVPEGAARVRRGVWIGVPVLLTLLTLLHLAFAPAALSPFDLSALFQWPSDLVLSLRWPRIVTALCAGAGMAVAGLILQRLIRNPLASPDILGMSAGATFALVAFTVFVGGSIHEGGPFIAFAGSATVLAVLLLLGRKTRYAPGIMILVGISLSAVIEALVHFVLAKGSDQAYAIIGWLSGSTYRVSSGQALFLAAGTVLLFLFSLMASRALTLISAGDAIAQARGLNTQRSRFVLLVLVCGFCALVTAIMGPIAFVGLLAPHVATMLGARKVWPQLWLAPAVGMMLMLFSDWLGWALLYPKQMPAGTIAAILGGAYFIFLLTRRRLG
ncbi:MAG: Fe(3+)-hydroxamate ABC transporter permease FhuB [Alteromonadaceae bacterium]|nr:Fe(3+)-hydroxamate ABC transporter permease FhuB [Alteromonadaceae bacterium]MBH85107.1 Fe(3+)-hydroxamate ABC transporter permease FhuB [Alteromonadaceae bacterium]|tara:strand:- start:37787 stop:39814 length:2028 start_codon:yes stop_codon:yes gene_type:complete